MVNRGLVVRDINSGVAHPVPAYPSAPYGYDEAPPAATYLGRLAPNTGVRPSTGWSGWPTCSATASTLPWSCLGTGSATRR